MMHDDGVAEADLHAVSILTRQWAKKAAGHFGITDTHKTLDQISAMEDDRYDDDYE